MIRLSGSLIFAGGLILSLTAAAEGPQCRKVPPAREISSVDSKAGAREPATYIPRVGEMREEMAILEERIRGFQQDILDFRKTEERFRQVLRDYRRLYPQGPSDAERDVESLYQTLKPAYAYFHETLRPTDRDCRRLIEDMEMRFLREPAFRRPEAEDANLAKRMIQKLCRMPASG